MLKKIESIRKKPKEVRQRYAFWYAIGFTAFIAVFWVSTLPSQFSFLAEVSTQGEQEQVQGGVSRSFADLRASLMGGVDAFRKIKEEATVLETAAEEDDHAIDFNTFFSSTSPQQNVVVPPIKQVLIGTSSAQQKEVAGE